MGTFKYEERRSVVAAHGSRLRRLKDERDDLLAGLCANDDFEARKALLIRVLSANRKVEALQTEYARWQKQLEHDYALATGRLECVA